MTEKEEVRRAEVTNDDDKCESEFPYNGKSSHGGGMVGTK